MEKMSRPSVGGYLKRAVSNDLPTVLSIGSPSNNDIKFERINHALLSSKRVFPIDFQHDDSEEAEERTSMLKPPASKRRKNNRITVLEDSKVSVRQPKDNASNPCRYGTRAKKGGVQALQIENVQEKDT